MNMGTEMKVIDFTFLQDFTKGNTEKMASFIKIYLKTAPKLFKELQNHTIEKNWEEVYLKAHNLKPQVQYVGITGLKELLIEIEKISKNGSEKSELKELVLRAVKLNEQGSTELNDFIISNNAD